MIEWTFESVKKQPEKVFVSGDSQEVLDLAKEYGFHILKRDAHLCEDETTMSDVLFDFAKKVPSQEEVMVLYPTNVLRGEFHIIESRGLWQAKGTKWGSLMSVSPVYHRPYGLMKIDEQGCLKLNQPEGTQYYRKQDVPIVYRANGAIFIIPIPLLLDCKVDSQLFSEKTLAYAMSEEDGFEIDTETDLTIAEALLGRRLASK